MGDATPFTKIIDAVRNHPELWSRQYAAYKNRLIQKKLWTKVAKKLRTDESLIKKRWKHLKDQYRKELKKSPDVSNPQSAWGYFPQMEFLRDEMMQAIREREQEIEYTKEAPPDSEPITEPENSFQKLDVTSNKLCRLTDLVESHINNCIEDSRRDPDMMFFMSLLPSMHKLSDIQKLQFRGQINEWLLEALTENEYGPVSPNYIDTKFFVQTELADEESVKESSEKQEKSNDSTT